MYLWHSLNVLTLPKENISLTVSSEIFELCGSILFLQNCISAPKFPFAIASPHILSFSERKHTFLSTQHFAYSLLCTFNLLSIIPLVRSMHFPLSFPHSASLRSLLKAFLFFWPDWRTASPSLISPTVFNDSFFGPHHSYPKHLCGNNQCLISRLSPSSKSAALCIDQSGQCISA